MCRSEKQLLDEVGMRKFNNMQVIEREGYQVGFEDVGNWSMDEWELRVGDAGKYVIASRGWTSVAGFWRRLD